MPAPLAKGIIITVSILVAAGIAAYESPQVREWLDQRRRKIAIALHSLGDEMNPRPRSSRQDDPSMREEMTDLAEARRRQARAEIMERGRIMEERRHRRRTARRGMNSQGSFDTLVDDNGMLRNQDAVRDVAITTAVDPTSNTESVPKHNFDLPVQPLHESVDSPISMRQLSSHSPTLEPEEDPFVARYEQEMRNAWNMELPLQEQSAISSHASESLLDFTPTSEVPADPEISVPNSSEFHHPLSRSEYFSATASASSHTLSDDEPQFYYAHPSNPAEPILPRVASSSRGPDATSISSAPSLAGSVDHVHASEVESSDDGVLSEFGDGIRTPASGWTEVGSIASSDAGY